MNNNEISTIINLCSSYLDKSILKNPKDFANLLGITIKEEDSPLINSSLIVNDKEKIITINKDLKEIIKNYYIILELVEYLLHYNVNSIIDIKCNIEYDTNTSRIANELLMPYDKFILIYKELVDSNYPENEIISILSNIFEVPREVISNRICNLNNDIKKKVLN